MFSKKVKRILAGVVCGVMTFAALPTIPAKATTPETTTCETYKMTSSKAFPEADKAGWQTARVLTDDENGLKVSNIADTSSSYVTRTSTPVALDGAHMQLTFEPGNNQFLITINHATEYNKHNLGISFKINLYSGGKIDCNVDGVAQETKTGMFTASSGVVEIKTSITDAGDFVFTINDYDYVVAKAAWTNSTNISADTPAYFAVAPATYAINYTWNYIHGGNDVCYSEVAAVETLIESMQTTAEIVEARKAYLALSEEEKAVVQNAEALMVTAGALPENKVAYKMTSSKAYPEANKSGWETARVLTDDAENGLKVSNAVANPAYVTRNSTPVKVDGAHMLLNFESGNNMFYVTINNGSGSYNDHTLGINFRVKLYSGGTIECYVDGVSQETKTGMFTESSGPVEIKTSIATTGDFVFTINGYDYVISKTVWANSTNISADANVHFTVAPGNYVINYTWNYIHGGDEVCLDGLADVESKIELCDPEDPDEDVVATARTAYDALSVGQKAIVINYDKLVSAEAEIADRNNHAQTEEWGYDEENHWKKCLCGECQYELAEHEPDIVNAEEATVDKEGYTGDKVCSICGYVIEQGTKIDQVKEVITSMTLSKTSYAYDGKVKKPTVTVKNQNGKVMATSSYTVTYASGCKNVGTYKVTVTKDGKSLTKTFQIIPPATSMKSISTGTTKPTVKWTKKTAGVTGYQVQYATNKSFENAKTVTIKKDTTTSTAISMSKGKTYYVRVRTYATASGKTYYSSWSSAKSTMIPNTTAIKSVTPGSKKLTVKWTKKTSYVTGYQIQYSTSKNFKSAKTVTIKKDTTTSTTIKKLTGKKKYYVRIRTYEKSGSTTYYSAWGTAKSVTTKK